MPTHMASKNQNARIKNKTKIRNEYSSERDRCFEVATPCSSESSAMSCSTFSVARKVRIGIDRVVVPLFFFCALTRCSKLALEISLRVDVRILV